MSELQISGNRGMRGTLRFLEGLGTGQLLWIMGIRGWASSSMYKAVH